MDIIILESAIVSVFFGAVFGYVARHYIAKMKRGSIEQEIEEKILTAKKEAYKIEEEALNRVRAEEESIDKKRKEFRKEEIEVKERMRTIEDRLLKRESDIDERDKNIRTEIEELKIKNEELNSIKDSLDEKSNILNKEIERVAHLSRTEAVDKLFIQSGILKINIYTSRKRII
jgi:ribonuclease Y